MSEKMKQFKLIDMCEQYRDIIYEAEPTSMDYRDFLVKLLMIEDEGKYTRRTEKLKSNAGFDSSSRLSDIDYTFNHSLDRQKIEQLGKLAFIEANENIIIIGSPGVGKSMIATDIGYNACDAGYKVLFVNAKELVDKLYNEMLEGNLEYCLNRLSKIQLLIIDELSYIKMDKERESLFFRLSDKDMKKASLLLPLIFLW